MVENSSCAYEVLSPWAEADPVPYRAISPRIGGLEGKKIGFFSNNKRVTEPTQKAVAARLQKQFPSIEISWFYNTIPNETITEQPRKGEFETWLKGVDAVIAAFGD